METEVFRVIKEAFVKGEITAHEFVKLTAEDLARVVSFDRHYRQQHLKKRNGGALNERQKH